ncbi:hypothetical protein Zmor_006489 [Zophobas morio]|uniref:Transmembrane protein n=1 Tax=Zophobas morio TaxID=2755281 RepID=A0AA38IRP0_9CUCU|nr:hypothetical protein Zmor_006489 [Zophobas morio]
MRRFRHGLPPTGTQKPRRKNDEKSGTPNGSTVAARFSNGTDQHWKRKNNSKRHRIIHNQKYNLLLEALERKSTVLSKRSKRSVRFYPKQNYPNICACLSFLVWLIANLLFFFSPTVSCAREIHLKFKNSNWILTVVPQRFRSEATRSDWKR